MWYLVWVYLGVLFPYSLNPRRWCNFGLEVNQYSTDGLSDGINGYAGDSFRVLASDALLETAVVSPCGNEQELLVVCVSVDFLPVCH